MKVEMHRISQQLEDSRQLEKSLNEKFTDNQIKILKSGGKRQKNG